MDKEANWWKVEVGQDEFLLGLVRFSVTVVCPSYNVYGQLQIAASGIHERLAQSVDLKVITIVVRAGR